MAAATKTTSFSDLEEEEGGGRKRRRCGFTKGVCVAAVEVSEETSGHSFTSRELIFCCKPG